MKTVNSISGGKTSSYLAMNYPADINVFSVVCIDCHNAGRSIDSGIKREISKRLEKTSPYYPSFKATAEDPAVLKVILELEQRLGKEITIVRGRGWEEMIKYKKALPNMFKRFCTSLLKFEPIFNYIYYRYGVTEMRLGIRQDESKRGYENNSVKVPIYSQYQEKSDRWIKRWKTIEWRKCSYPLIVDKITKSDVNRYWKGKGIEFPEISNCLFCFWKQFEELKKNYSAYNEIMQWAKIQEDLIDRTFKEKISLHGIDCSGEPLKLF